MGKLDLIEKSADHSADVTTGSKEVVPVNKMRSSCLLVNDSDVVIYLGFGRDAALNIGLRLNAAGGAYEISLANPYRGYITAIHGGSGNKRLTITEVEGYVPD
ncbi:unnamed protein product [marine sediment metagenome]|uniref:Uncharacterized protein n=1 Tax=marine sediment metagenome TaxID=412755 RepID=X1QUJ7_9ZZZZ